MKVAYLHRGEIDDHRWDETISRSGAETIYPYSWYLDRAAASWSALVMGDYRFLMPLVWKRKWGFRYLYQPFYTQQLGVFSEDHVDPTIVAEMLSHIPKRFRFAHINFNSKNLVSEAKSISVNDRINYILDLSGTYDDISGHYSTNAARNIRKGTSTSAPMLKNLSCSELVAFKRKNDVVTRGDRDYAWLTELLENLMNRGSGVIYSVGEGENLNAAAFFAFSRARAIYLVSASSETGKEQRSMFRIVDTFIREHAGSGLILDFEGSTIPSVARFFSGFGASPEVYQSVGFSRFPFNLLKK